MYNVQVSTLPFHRGDHAAQASAFRRCNWEPAAGGRHTKLDTNVGPASLAKTQPTGTVRPQGLEQQPRSARKREELKTHAVLQDEWRREPLKHVQSAASASSAGKACNPQAWRPKHCKWHPKPRQVLGQLRDKNNTLKRARKGVATTATSAEQHGRTVSAAAKPRARLCAEPGLTAQTPVVGDTQKASRKTATKVQKQGPV